MTTSMPNMFPPHTNYLWQLANATVCDAKDVASVLPVVSHPVLLDELRSGFSALTSVIKLRGGFQRLVIRQDKLLERFGSARPETWSHSDCREMSGLLDELLADERMVLTSAFDSPGHVFFWWKRSLTMLKRQVAELEAICVRIDALSVAEKRMPGDADYRDFMQSLLQTNDEHDFTTDEDCRKATLVT